MPTKRRAFTVVELTLACSLFALLSVVLALALRQVSELWLKTNAKDEAVRSILKARSSLIRDLANSSAKANQSGVAVVGPHLGTGKDSDALTFLSSDSGATTDSWSTDSTGGATFPSQITYYCVIPNAPNPGGAVISAGPADAQGYEQQHPFKWLVRRVDPAPGGAPPAIDATWTGWLTRPTTFALGANQKVVATQMLQLRVLSPAPLWTLELRAVSVSEARRKIALGGVPLSQGRFTLAQRFSVAAHN
jgi:type II secretory pathway pseudopilin PulG